MLHIATSTHTQGTDQLHYLIPSYL